MRNGSRQRSGDVLSLSLPVAPSKAPRVSNHRFEATAGFTEVGRTLGWLGTALTSGAKLERAEKLDPSAWSRLVRLARAHGVAPLLYHRLREAALLKTLPREAAIFLEHAHFETAAYNTLLYDELERILPPLGETVREGGEEGKLVVLKGADLALNLYPSIALRPMCDVDLLLPRSRLSEAVSVLEGLGYRKTTPEMGSRHDWTVGHAIAMAGGPRRRVSVELHWSLVASDLDWRSPKPDWVWAHVVPVPSRPSARRGDRPPPELRRLGPEANLLYLAAHLVLQHGPGEGRLIWLHDLHLLVSRYGATWDWGEVVAEAEALRWMSALRVALETAHEHFGTPLSPRLRDPAGRTRMSTGRSRWGIGGRQALERSERAWSQMMCLSWRGRLRFVWNHCFPRRSYLKWRYEPRPSCLWPLCYPYRWYGIAVDLLGLVARRWRG